MPTRAAVRKPAQHVARQVIQEAEHFREDLAKIHEHVEEVTRGLAEDLAGRMAELLNASLEQSLLQPLETPSG